MAHHPSFDRWTTVLSQTLANHYHITALIGSGAMGVAYRATGKGK